MGYQNMKVSVIVPVYKVEKFLRKCLDSITSQTLTNIEIICVNDGSPDNCEKILEEYKNKDSRIKVIKQQNSGVSVARNTGLEVAQGEYVSFVDSDDWIDKDFLEKSWVAAKKYDADIAACGIKRVRNYKWRYHLKFDKEECIKDNDAKFKLCDVPEKCYVWNKIYKLSELKKYNIQFEPKVLFEDRLFTCESLIKLNSLVTVPDVYYNYWTNPNSIVKTKTEKLIKDDCYTRDKMMNYLEANNINLDHFPIDFTRYRFCGVTLLKVKTFKDRIEYTLFNILKYVRKLK